MYEFAEQTAAYHVEDHWLGIVVTAVFHDEAMASHFFGSVDKLPTVLDGVSCRNFGAYMLACFQGRQGLRHMPLPGRSDVNEIEIVAFGKLFEISLTIGIYGWCFLPGLFNELSRAQTLLLNHIPDRINDNLIERQKLSQHIGAT